MLILDPTPFSIRKFEILIGNIKVLSAIETEIRSAGLRGFLVNAGVQLGLPIARTGCEDFVRVTMRKESGDEEAPYTYVDPQAYLMKAPLGLPQWVTEADQWYIKLLVVTIRQVLILTLLQLHLLPPSFVTLCTDLWVSFAHATGHIWCVVPVAQRRQRSGEEGHQGDSAQVPPRHAPCRPGSCG